MIIIIIFVSTSDDEIIFCLTLGYAKNILFLLLVRSLYTTPKIDFCSHVCPCVRVCTYKTEIEIFNLALFVVFCIRFAHKRDTAKKNNLTTIRKITNSISGRKKQNYELNCQRHLNQFCAASSVPYTLAWVGVVCVLGFEEWQLPNYRDRQSKRAR